MAFTVTLSELRNRVREFTDTVNALTPTNAQLDVQINRSVRSLYARICEGGAEFLTTSTTVTTAAGVGTYDLPADFWRLRSVVWRRGTRDVVPLSRFEQRDRAELESEPWSGRARYRLADVAFNGGTPTIEFCPPPDRTCTMFIAYVPDPPTLEDENQEAGTPAVPLVCTPGMDEWIALDVTCRVLATEETDVTSWAQLRGDVWTNEIVPSLGLRDEHRTNAISDHDADEVW